MQQVCIHGPGDTRIDEVDPPDPGPGDVVVKVTACGICGSDLSYIRMGGITPDGSPTRLGHEMAGVVDWVGPDVSGTSVGDRVVVHPGDADSGEGLIGNGGPEGGLAQMLLVRDAARGGRVFPVPDDLPLDIASLAEPVAVGMQSANRTDAVLGDKVAVFGCGPIGLAAIATLVDRGIDVVGIDLSARRLELAGAIGAQAVLNPAEVDVWEELSRLHGTAPFIFGPTPATNAFVEATGSGAVITDIIEKGRAGARLSVVAMHLEPVPINFLFVMSKKLQIKGSMGYPDRFEDAIDLLGRRDLSTMITHRVPLANFDDALAVLDADKNCGKVLVTMGGES
jgi:(R,R)-butanediol dehydrogenase / meso-butanediol dehydrogenase / diacetyl reductase